LTLLLAALLTPLGTRAQEPLPARVSLSADELLALASRAVQAGDAAAAESLYRALFADPTRDVRAEARFRLALLFARAERYPAAALLLREILDEQPGAQRVRLEYARVLDLMGDEAGARKALREVQAGNLPPEVVRMVDRYSAALRARKPFGGSLEVAIAPDSNVNRATRADVLGTVLGDLTLDEAAQARSGIGLAARGQVYARHSLGAHTNILGRASASATLYANGAFNEVIAGLAAGPEYALGNDRLNLELGGDIHWFGGEAYARIGTLSAIYLHPLDRRSQLRASLAAGVIDNRLNAGQDGHTLSASLQYERALSVASGVGVSLNLQRDDLAASFYSSFGGQLTAFGYRDFGPTTLVASATHGRLRFDERLPLFHSRRSDSSLQASLSAQMRTFKVAGFAPFVKVELQRNRSTITLHRFNRTRAEIGLVRAY